MYRSESLKESEILNGLSFCDYDSIFLYLLNMSAYMRYCIKNVEYLHSSYAM